jgi:methylenetetrahydrofolate reductase (NADPH)
MKIRDLISSRRAPFWSLEFFPPKEQEKWPHFFSTVEQLKNLNPLFASVTYGAGGSTQDATLDIALHIKNMLGIEPLVHLTCMGSTRQKLSTYLRKLTDAGIENILALRGDLPKDAPEDAPNLTDFKHASDLVRFVRENFPTCVIAVAGYPSSHHESPSFQMDLEYTKLKIRSGVDLLITQLFFDVREYFEFVDRLRGMGMQIPLLPGILPIQSMASLRRILNLCDAKIPGKLYLALEEAENKGGEEALREVGINFAVNQICRLLDEGAPGVHLYTMNRANMCLRIAEDVKSRGYKL